MVLLSSGVTNMQGSAGVPLARVAAPVLLSRAQHVLCDAVLVRRHAAFHVGDYWHRNLEIKVKVISIFFIDLSPHNVGSKHVYIPI